MKVELISQSTIFPDDLCGKAASICCGSKDEKKSLNIAINNHHESVLEHANFTFEICNVSSILLAQLTRHRFFSFSVRSERYCGGSKDYVIPPTIADNVYARREFYIALDALEEAYKEKTGQELVKVFRPPEGSFTKKHLEVLSESGYKTIFWSIAYADWLVDKQKSKEVAYNAIMNNLHAGAIILMHTVSKTNSEVLPLIIDRIIQDGYEFDLVTNLQKKIS